MERQYCCSDVWPWLIIILVIVSCTGLSPYWFCWASQTFLMRLVSAPGDYTQVVLLGFVVSGWSPVYIMFLHTVP